MDRFDCQYLMATFVNVYISSFILTLSPQKLLQQVIKFLTVQLYPYALHINLGTHYEARTAIADVLFVEGCPREQRNFVSRQLIDHSRSRLL
jgi:hypothetical protein